MTGARSKAGASKKADNKLATKRKGVEKAAAPAKRGKAAAKDPNKPKRPASAFFVFMEEFRKDYKEKYPNNKSVANVSKAGGEKWKSMSDSEKAPYVAKADKRKVEYTKTMDAYNKKQSDPAAAEDDEESDKSKSEVNDEDEEEGSGENEEEEDDD